MDKAKWCGNPVCLWLTVYFCFVCCSDEASCTGCCWWLGDAGSCIQVVSFVWILTVWYSLGLASWEIDEETVDAMSDFIFLGSKITADGDCSKEIKRHLNLGRKVMTNLDSILKSRNITLPTKVHLVKAMVFSTGHVWMWELDCEESWALKNRCFWTMVLEKTLESPLDCKEI